MAKKKKAEEPQNMERWMVSYSDFVTLLFATFVVLYALSQTDIQDFKKFEQSMQSAFSAPSLLQGSDGVMDNSSNSIFDSKSADSVVSPLMLEYMSPKYENDSMEKIKDKIDSEGLKGVDATITEKGLLIRINNDCLFSSGSTKLTNEAQKKLDKIGLLILTKFVFHKMSVEGYTDNQPIQSKEFASNWELSAVRATTIVRYLIKRFDFSPKLFMAVGMADNAPIADNGTSIGRERNRRIEILILKNKYGSRNMVTTLSKSEQEKMQANRINTVNKFESMSDATRELAIQNEDAKANLVNINKTYDAEQKRIAIESQALDKQTQMKVTGSGDWLKPPGRIIK